ncbi:MAG: chalcone isomerase [Desulfobacterales bacterium]|nr:chalcone isomerase [Desulfobacterales bacterium]MCP4161816.1 chalcone isomerase [Deltaproteobacteria bacterium]
MFKKLVILSLALFLVLPSSLTAKEVSGVDIPEAFKEGGQDLVLNGVGIRSKFFMDIYVGALYLIEKSKDGNAVSNDDKVMNIRLHMVSGLITNEKMTNAVNEGFEKSTKKNTAPVKAEITQFTDVFKEKFAKGDYFDFSYVPGIGTKIYKNGTVKATIKGLEFKKALFGIWFCEDPADDDLKEEMLGDD